MFIRSYLILAMISLLILITGCASEDHDVEKNDAKEYDVKVQVTPAESGKVAGEGTYREGEKVNLKADPGEGYTFANWIENGEPLHDKKKEYQFGIDKDKKLTAEFTRKEHEVKIGTNLGDDEIATGGGIYKHGEEAKIELKDSADLEKIEFKKWIKNGEKVSDEKSFSFTVKEDARLIADSELVHIEELVLKDDIEGFLLPVWENDNLGFINNRGEQIVKADEIISGETLPQQPHPEDRYFIELTDTYKFRHKGPFLFLKLNVPGVEQTQKVVFNKNGELIAKMPSEKASGFNEEGVITYEGGSYGFVDAEGRRVLDLEYDDISTIWDSNYMEIAKDGKKGVFDPVAEEVVVEIQYDDIEKRGWVEEELFKVREGSDKILFDKNGNKIAKLDFDETGRPSEGFISARKGERWGFINLSGEVVIEPEFDEVERFSEGYAVVKQDEGWGLIDKEGEFLIEPKFDRLSDTLIEGLYRFDLDAKTGYINQEGEVLVKGKYDILHLYSYNNSHVFIFEENEKAGLLSEEGELIKEPVFEHYSRPYGVGTCKQSAAYVAQDYLVFNKDGLRAVFHDGDFITDFKFKEIGEFGRPMKYGDVIQFKAKVEGEPEKGLYDVEDGEYIIEPGDYDHFDYLINNRARVKQDGKFGFVGENGSKEINPEYDYATRFQNELAAVKKDNDLKLIDRNGETIEHVKDFKEEIVSLIHLGEPEVYRLNRRYYFSKDHGWLRKPE